MKEGGIAEFCSEEIITARGAAPRGASFLRACARAPLYFSTQLPRKWLKRLWKHAES